MGRILTGVKAVRGPILVAVGVGALLGAVEAIFGDAASVAIALAGLVALLRLLGGHDNAR